MPYTPKLGDYTYVLRGKLFVIHRVTSVTPHGYSATRTGEYFYSREEARRRVYQLNGWKPRQQQ